MFTATDVCEDSLDNQSTVRNNVSVMLCFEIESDVFLVHCSRSPNLSNKQNVQVETKHMAVVDVTNADNLDVVSANKLAKFRISK